MTLRIAAPNLVDTQALLEQVLPHIVRDERVAFTVPAGTALKLLNRMRVMLSRRRKALQRRGKNPKQFILCSSVHPETHDGVRLECVVLWQQITERNQMAELLQDVLAQ